MEKLMKLKKKKSGSLFYKIFVGEFVQIVIKADTRNVVQNEEEMIDQSMPMAIEAFLLDEDDDYYYLGSPEVGVTSAIKKDEVRYIVIAEHKNSLDSILDDMETPQDEKEIN